MKPSIWDRLSRKYDTLWVQKHSLSPTRKKITEILGKLVTQPDFKMLDIGCGTGQLIEDLSAQYPLAFFTGIDKSERMVALAQEKNPSHRFLTVAAEKLAFDEACFDFITCCHSFPYYQDKEAVVDRIKKILKPNGYAIFVQASVNNRYDHFVMWIVEKTAETAEYLSRREVRRFFTDGFTVVQEFIIKEKWYMPSICGFVLRGRKC